MNKLVRDKIPMIMDGRGDSYNITCNHLIGCLGDNLEAALRLVEYMKGGDAL